MPAVFGPYRGTLLDEGPGCKIDDSQGNADERSESTQKLEEFNEVLVHALRSIP